MIEIITLLNKTLILSADRLAIVNFYNGYSNNLLLLPWRSYWEVVCPCVLKIRTIEFQTILEIKQNIPLKIYA